MMKKLLLLFLPIVFVAGVYAQELTINKSAQWVNLQKVQINKPKHDVAPITRAASSYMWWGYPDAGGSVNVLGFDILGELLNGGSLLTGQKNYNLAMEVPKSFAGAIVDSINIAFWEPSTMSNLKIWFSEYKTDASGNVVLPTSPAKADYSFTVDAKTVSAKAFNDFKLPQSYKIPANGCVVGYSFTDIAGTTPILSHATNGTEGGFYFQYNVNTLTRSWFDFSAEGYGDLTISLHMDASMLSKNKAMLYDFNDDFVTTIGRSVSLIGYVLNEAVVPINEISYIVYQDGVASEEQTVQLSQPVMNKTLGSFLFTMNTTKEGVNSCEVEITKVNGEPNETSNIRRATATAIALDKFAERTSVIEEFTGSWCGYCPRGTVGLNRLKSIYGDKIITLAIHYNDPMLCRSYNDFLGNAYGFPDAMVDRAYHGDPYMGMNRSYVFAADKMVEAVADTYLSEGTIALNALWTDNSKTKIKVEASSTFLYTRTDENPYAIVFVLSEDGMTGTGTDWQQANYYSGATDFNDPDMLKYINGGNYVDEVFNHVAVQAWDVVTGMDGSVASVTRATPQTFETTLDISENTLIQNKSNLSLAALLINRKNGRIVNAAQVKLSDATGIVGVEETKPVEATYYNINGMRTNTPSKGINIIRKTDGKVVKVIR